jgi:peptidoglycan/LPS O-acetylase OafA/YrhL
MTSGTTHREPATALAGEAIPSRALDDMNWLRGLSAIAVFTNHLRGAFLQDFSSIKASPGLRVLYFVTGAGHLAVNVFFVLSGFFIGTSVADASRRGAWSWTRFAMRRFTRLYVVLVPALLLTAALDSAGMRLFGTSGIYGGHVQAAFLRQPDVTTTYSLRVLIGNLLFLQSVAVPGLGSNFPLWSLGYEFWCYAVFPLLFRGVLSSEPLPRRVAFLVGAGVILALGGSLFRFYFSVWMLGALVALYWRHFATIFRFPPARLVAVVAFVGALLVGRAHALGSLEIEDLSLGVASAMLLSASLGRAVTRSAVDARAASTGSRYARWGELLASFSYTLYVVHLPVLTFLQAWLVGPRQWPPDLEHVAALSLVALGVVCLVVYPLAKATEGHTDEWRRRVARWFPSSTRSAAA